MYAKHRCVAFVVVTLLLPFSLSYCAGAASSLLLGRRPQGKQLRRSTRTLQELRTQSPSVQTGEWL